MKMFLKHAAIGGVALLAMASAALAFQDEGTVRIGLIEAQTGVPAPYGLQGLNGSKIAVDEINAAGGVMVDGKKVKLAVTPAPNGYDPAADSALTVALMKKLISDDKVLVIKGTSRSQNTEVAFNYLGELEKAGSPIVLLSSASSSSGLGKISKWGFRNAFFEEQIVDREVEKLTKEHGVKTAGLYFVQDNPYNIFVINSVIKPALKKYGVEVVAETTGVDATTDLSTQVATLRKAKPDIIWLSATTLSSVGLMKEAQRRGLKPKAWLGTVANIAPEMLKLGGPAVEGLILGSSFSPNQARVQGLRKEYLKRTGVEINLFGVNGYEAIYIFKAAIEASGIKNTQATLQEDRAKFRDALAKTKITSITGESVAFENNDARKQGFILAIRNGAFTEWNGKLAPR